MMDTKEIAKGLKAVVFDSIGVLFSATVIYNEEEEVLRTRSHLDGQGISLLRAAGLQILFMSASRDNFIYALADRFNHLPSVLDGSWGIVEAYAGITGQEKAHRLGYWLAEKKIDPRECAYMGDDIGDYQVMQMVGLRAVPASGEDFIKKDAHFVANRNGGEGAVRDLCNFILSAKGVDVTKLALR